MRRTFAMGLTWVMALLLAGPAAGQNVVQRGDNLVEVTVTGVGMTKKEAVNDALRKAVEQGAGTFIYSQSQTEDFVLVRDTVLARSAGFVQEKKVLSAREDPIEGTWEVKLKAVVSVQGIEDTWGVVKNLLAQMGRPKIMVAVTEAIDEQGQEDSTVQTRIENLLLESGFRLVNKEQLSAIEKKQITVAVAANKPEAVQAIAQKFGAQLFITGSTSAAIGTVGGAYGVDIHRYGADGDIKCYRSDTAELLSSRNGRAFSADRTKRLAAKKALSQLGNAIGPVIQQDILYYWQDALQGRGSAKLVVEGIDFDDAMALEDALGALEEITSVDTEFNDTIAEFELEASLPAKKLARALSKKIKAIKITNVSQNVIKATYQGD